MPSVDIMMNAVLGVYRENTIGVLMTGIGDDGADATVKIKKAGGHTIAESEETAVVFGMPRAVERGGKCVGRKICVRFAAQAGRSRPRRIAVSRRSFPKVNRTG